MKGEPRSPGGIGAGKVPRIRRSSITLILNFGIGRPMLPPDGFAASYPTFSSMPSVPHARGERQRHEEVHMKLYYSPLACSLADHIALAEAGVTFEIERVDLKTKKTASGLDFNTINPKGYVPALVLDDGEIITENIAILDWLATQFPYLGASGPLGRTRLLEALAFISSEVHRNFKPMWHGGSDAERAQAGAVISELLGYLADRLVGTYLFGSSPSVADFYLFVMLLWAERFDVGIPAALMLLRHHMASRPAVQAAMLQEGLFPGKAPQRRIA
jgi:glutathione S-transferase